MHYDDRHKIGQILDIYISLPIEYIMVHAIP